MSSTNGRAGIEGFSRPQSPLFPERGAGDRGIVINGFFRADIHPLLFACRRYTLSVVQQPRRSAEFGSNVLSRLPLAPPLIVRLDVTDADGNDVNM